jgi:hypothetical protein
VRGQEAVVSAPVHRVSTRAEPTGREPLVFDGVPPERALVAASIMRAVLRVCEELVAFGEVQHVCRVCGVLWDPAVGADEWVLTHAPGCLLATALLDCRATTLGRWPAAPEADALVNRMLAPVDAFIREHGPNPSPAHVEYVVIGNGERVH